MLQTAIITNLVDEQTPATETVEHVRFEDFFSPQDEEGIASSWNVAEDVIENAEQNGIDTTTLAFHASLMDYEEGAYTYHRRHMSTLRTIRSLMARDAEGEIDLSSEDLADLTTCGMLNF